jgi:hypothetical protein
MHDRHADLLAADRIHLFTQDPLDFRLYSLTEREIGKDAGGEWLYKPGAQQELVAGRLSFGRRLPQSFAKEYGTAH